MQEVIHLPSNTKALRIGSHQGMRATLVRLQSGQEQYWRNDHIQFLGEDSMTTNKIMLRLSGPKGNTWQLIERIFETIEEASQYLQELTRFHDIKGITDSGETCSLTNGWSISSNHCIKKLLKAEPIKKPLPDWYPFDLRKSSLTLGGVGGGEVPKRASTQSTGQMVKLQDIVKEPRKARVILRSLVNKKKIVKPARWEWAEGSDDLATVQAALKGL